jgi:hypothetical protein
MSGRQGCRLAGEGGSTRDGAGPGTTAWSVPPALPPVTGAMSIGTHTMSLSNSSEMEDQITMAFLDVMDEAMSIVQAEEATAATAFSSTQMLKHHRCYVNRDREAAHFRLRHDYFDDNCVYPCHTSIEGIICGRLFSYALYISLVKHLCILVRGMMQLIVLA